jgi:eukaryotic-like serine/threonine-protein kinase
MSVAAERDDWAGLLEDTEGSALPAFLPEPRRFVEPLLAPRQVLAGRFFIVRLIARGAMGALYEARDEERQTQVAVKTLHPSLAADSAAMDRLRSEVLLARRLRHPGVCRVLEVYALRTPAGVPLHFLTRELIAGTSLAERMAQRGPFREAEALPLLREMAEALSAAHAIGLVHRDFKPSNVLLVPREDGSGSERVVVTDFGIVRALLPDRRRSEPLPALVVDLLDSLDHLAPEQLGGGVVGPATDVYALGVVLHQMVTGRLPSVHPLGPLADSSIVPPVALMPELDARWNETILRCLERTPGRRFQDPLEAVAALAQ